MSDNEQDQDKPFCVDKAKQSRATCKKCKEKCMAGEIRIAKLAYNPFGGPGKLKQWYHVPCLFETFLNQKLSTKRLTDPIDIEGWDEVEAHEQNCVTKCIEETEEKLKEKFGDKYVRQEPETKKVTEDSSNKNVDSNEINKNYDKDHKDNLFREFRRLTADVTNESSYLEKSAIMKKFLTDGSDGTGFKGDIVQWCRLLLPGVIKRIYNLQSKQLIKLFSGIFGTNREEMLENLEKGDIGETIQYFFENSQHVKPAKKSLLKMQEVDDFLEQLTELTKEEEQTEHFKNILPNCTGNDLKTIIRLIKHDLRMNAGAKHVLDAVHPDAYQAFQASRNLPNVLKRVLGKGADLHTSKTQPLQAKIQIMTPVLPMLAEACKSVDQAMRKCPNGMYSEIKYDGERVQVHKHQSEFKYFSRSLKPVMDHKVSHFKDYIPKAFPHAKDLILDSEVLLIDTNTSKPLPFGSLGVHKREAFKDATVCLFVFDCIYYNGESLTHKTMRERREILHENMTEIPNRIMFSETEEVYKAADLAAMITKVLKLGLEGLVLKDMDSIYEPGKRHWLKVKKDYLCGGAMADSADLIVVGAWFGTGKKGGMMSIFLMGCYDPDTDKFYTVTKVHTGHDDKTLEQLQTELDMIKISGDQYKVPSWLRCNRSMVPDFVARDPKMQPVWEITGAEFTQHEVHTADGISIRFPRVTHIRSDKDWKSATSLQELKQLFKTSKENTDFTLLTNETDEGSLNKKNVGKKMKKDESDNENTDNLNTKENEEIIVKQKGKRIPGKKLKKVTKNKIDDIKVENENEDYESWKLKQITMKELKRKANGEGNMVTENESDTEEENIDFIETCRKRKSDEMKKESPKRLKITSELVNEDFSSNESNDSIRRRSNNLDDASEMKGGCIRIGNHDYFPIFRDTKIVLGEGVRENFEGVIQHFHAAGGKVLEEDEYDEAMYVVHRNVEYSSMVSEWGNNVRHVTVDWLRDCVGNGGLIDARAYAVKWLQP